MDKAIFSIELLLGRWGFFKYFTLDSNSKCVCVCVCVYVCLIHVVSLGKFDYDIFKKWRML